MNLTSDKQPVFTLNGLSISTLNLAPETETAFRDVGISTLERLATLALRPSETRECELVDSIRRELQARLGLYPVACYTSSGYAAHLIIRADGLFFFKASVIPDDDSSWSCTYQWRLNEELIDAHATLVPFYIPQSLACVDLPPVESLSIRDASVEANEASKDIITSGSAASDGDGMLNEDASREEDILLEGRGDASPEQEPSTEILIQQHDQCDSLHTVLEAIVSMLSQRDRQVLELRYGLQDGYTRTLEVVGKAFGCTRAWISQLELKAFRKIRGSRRLQARIKALLARLDKVMEQSSGVLSVHAALHVVGYEPTADEQSQMIAEAKLRFLLSFDDAIDIPKGLMIVALKRQPYAKVFNVLSNACGALQRVLQKATGPLTVEEVVAQLDAGERGHAIVEQVPSPTLAACLAALPNVVTDEYGRYYQAGRTFFTSLPILQRSNVTAGIPHFPEAIHHKDFLGVQGLSAVDRSGNAQPADRPWDSYDIWNHALATYVTAGAQRGSVVYLSIDDEVIAQISQRLQTEKAELLEDFLISVQHRVVRGRRVQLDHVGGRNQYSEPNNIAFLAAMVLSASRMAEDEDEEIASSNYFTRLCEVLDLSEDDGRPIGMKAGSEEPLWREWIVWLSEIGLIASAQAGVGRRDKFINYPISQALLRGADRDRLQRLFNDMRWSESWDSDTLLFAVRREAQRLSKHLRNLLDDRSLRTQAVAEAIQEIYEEWLRGADSMRSSGQARGHILLADILRNEDPISGEIDYFIYPRSPRRQQIDIVVVQIAAQRHTLVYERPGRYAPICIVDEQQLNQGVSFPIEQPNGLDALVVPRRAFWLLSPDPDNPESGIYASWGTIPLGTPFILLCRRDLVPQIEFLRAERLIEWSGEPRSLLALQDWVEITDCMVISPSWDGVEIDSRELHEALRPRETLSISFSGGLRAPHGGWLVGHGPNVTIFGFPPEADVMVTRITDGHTLLEETRPTNRPFDLAWPASGDYLVELVSGASPIRRLVKIVDWDELEYVPINDLQWLEMDDLRICGALIEGIAKRNDDASLV